MKCFKNKRILITGNTGFKGTWLTLSLYKFGAKIIGYSDLKPKKKSILSTNWLNENIKQYYNKIENFHYLDKVIHSEKPDLIFHLAAQPLVLKSYADPKKTFETNTIGTLNILEVTRNYNKDVPVVIITTDKVYSNHIIKKYKENDILSGNCPYSASKVCAEEIAKSYSKLGMKIITARAGNIIGGGDWADDRLIPDLIKAIKNEKTPVIRHPHSTRPWLYILDAINGYLLIGKYLLNIKKNIYFNSYNLSPNYRKPISVLYLTKKILKHFNKSFSYKSKRNDDKKENKFLSLCSKKIKKEINWYSKISIEQAIHKTANWYKLDNRKEFMLYSSMEVNDYFKIKKIERLLKKAS